MFLWKKYLAISVFVTSVSCNPSMEEKDCHITLLHQDKLNESICRSIEDPGILTDTIIYKQVYIFCGLVDDCTRHRFYSPNLFEMKIFEIVKNKYFNSTIINDSILTSIPLSDSVSEMRYTRLFEKSTRFSISGNIISEDSVRMKFEFSRDTTTIWITKLFFYKNDEWQWIQETKEYF